jgi:hypothetical protein
MSSDIFYLLINVAMVMEILNHSPLNYVYIVVVYFFCLVYPIQKIGSKMPFTLQSKILKKSSIVQCPVKKEVPLLAHIEACKKRNRYMYCYSYKYSGRKDIWLTTSTVESWCR